MKFVTIGKVFMSNNNGTYAVFRVGLVGSGSSEKSSQNDLLNRIIFVQKFAFCLWVTLKSHQNWVQI